MSVLIGSARIDEHGNAIGGAAGDQKNGKEVSTQTWYIHSKGWRVFRAKSPEKAKMLAYDMRAACANNNIGYDQSPAPSLFNVAKTVGFDCAKVKTKCETDCSKLVRVCCWYAGIEVPFFTTASEPGVLIASGFFDELTGDKYTRSCDFLRVGDILVTKKRGHTVIVLTDGARVDKDPQTFDFVEVTGDSVFVRKNPGPQNIVIGVVYKGDRFPCLHETRVIAYPDGHTQEWYKIQYDDSPGWISGKYSVLTT